MTKFITVDVGPVTNCKDNTALINVDHITHFFTIPADAERAEMTMIKLASGETIACKHDYKSVMHQIINS